MARVFIGMETSGMTRRAFERAGHEVISCDLLPSQDGVGWYISWVKDEVTPRICIKGHIIGDVFAVLQMLAAFGWRPDFALFHPDCTYLTISATWAFNDPDFQRWPGVGYHQRVKPGTLTGAARREARAASVQLVRDIWALDIERVAIENPVGYLSSMWMKPTQIVQPYEYGDDASKKTCLWLRNLPPLIPTKRVYGRFIVLRGKLIERFSNQTDEGQNNLAPSDDRWQVRADTYPGISDAMAKYWLRDHMNDDMNYLLL